MTQVDKVKAIIPRRNTTTTELRRLRALAAAGMTQAAIAREMRRSVYWVARWCAHEGLELPGKGRRKPAPSPVAADEAKERLSLTLQAMQRWG